MKFIVKSNNYNLNYNCSTFGGSSACGQDCSSKCYLCTCNNGYGSCREAVLV